MIPSLFALNFDSLDRLLREELILSEFSVVVAFLENRVGSLLFAQLVLELVQFFFAPDFLFDI